MNIFILSIIDKRIGRVMVQLSQLRHFLFFLEASHYEILLSQIKIVIDTYVSLFQCVHLLPDHYTYSETTISKVLSIGDEGSDRAEGIDKRLLALIETSTSTQIIPVSIHITEHDKIFIYLGLGIIENSGKTGRFYLQELYVATAAFNYSLRDHLYLEDALISKIKSLRLLAAEYGKNYNHFQQDSKAYLGDTFYQFQNKLRMMEVIEDIMFTHYSFKEIAYRNNFAGYSGMYILFHKKYNFPLDSIPRLVKEKQG